VELKLKRGASATRRVQLPALKWMRLSFLLGLFYGKAGRVMPLLFSLFYFSAKNALFVFQRLTNYDNKSWKCWA
jgi:hypothetical protein